MLIPYQSLVSLGRFAKKIKILLTKPPVPASIQALQTLAHLAHLYSQIEGFIGTFGTISMFFVHMTKAMKTDRLDTARCREKRKRNGANMADIEVKRRVWWHLVASDWYVTCLAMVLSLLMHISGSCPSWVVQIYAPSSTNGDIASQQRGRSGYSDSYNTLDRGPVQLAQ